ncbi:tetraacyldisaccharide 4'-kinase [Mesoflavibacter sp. SCSIO 43206]|uniref:tetraacyldisaccharide 4'-kinase n=1 Tax=Mesoflavibacter sp. SCSIO 43206 TaxID=2779362 RepID=UPI001CA9DC72|nr:tetraacyldisaccharide 4'-kinase [Mesoflavibacter sp. SCSIO 43206]UAB74382.1 tetraacyldisaccharide 4'-kinase [Mesoflavibacter sp. SCSIO 43206]
MKFIRIILFPFVPIYFLATWFRNFAYDKGWFKSMSYDFPIICVGNLSAGGTGKTPMVEYLIRLLKDETNLVTLSRGYGRKTKGFLLAEDNITASELGDEPFQFYHKFKDEITVAVDEDRQHGISTLRAIKPKPEVVILDDAFQHRKVKAGYNILLTTYNNLYVDDFVLPTGNLREPKKGAKRANIIVVTKCPEILSQNDKEAIVLKLKPKVYQHVFFSHIGYNDLVLNETEKFSLNKLESFTLVTGIANAKPLVNYLKSLRLDFNHIEFKDHHNFTENDIKKLSELDKIVTTEKDYMRLKNEAVLKDKLYFLPIKTVIDNSEQFDALVKAFTLG